LTRLTPNAQTHLPLEAAATQERRLEAVRCSAMFGWGAPLGRQRSAPYHGRLRLGVGSLRLLSSPTQRPGARLLDDLVRQNQQGRRYRDPQGLGGLEVNAAFELHGLLHG
jgi:hypothetical protein